MNGMVTAHYQDFNLTDGREVFKYGTNPMDNDTDGDMIPDWYEYAKAWNESNDNYSSFLQIRVDWIDLELADLVIRRRILSAVVIGCWNSWSS